MGRRRKDPGLDLLFGIAKVGFDVGKAIVKSQQQSKKPTRSRKVSYEQKSQNDLSNHSKPAEPNEHSAAMFIVVLIILFIIIDNIFFRIISAITLIGFTLIFIYSKSDKDSGAKPLENKQPIDRKPNNLDFADICMGGNLQLAKKYLQDNPQAINEAKKANKNTPLMCAITAGNAELIKYLLDNGADINVKNVYGITPFDLARRTNNREILDLIEGKVNAKCGFANKQDTIREDLPKSEAPKHTEEQAEPSPSINNKSEDTDEFISLINSCKNGDFERVKQALTKRPKLINQSSTTDQKTPLMHAITAGNLELIRYLLSRGADINAKNKYGATLTELARRNFLLTNNREILDLIEGKVNAKCGFANKQDATQQALPKSEAPKHIEEREAGTWEEKQRKNIERYKTSQQSKINETAQQALPKSEAPGHVEEQAKPSPSINNKSEDTDEFISLINSCKNGDFERVKQILTKRSELINQSSWDNIDQKTPLMHAINVGNLRLIRYLLKRGADINTENAPRLIALANGNFLLTNNREILDLIEGRVNAKCGFANKQDTIQKDLPKSEAPERKEEWSAKTWEEMQRKNMERCKCLQQSKINEPNKEAIKTLSTHNLLDSYVVAFQNNDNEKIRNFIINGRDPNMKYNGNDSNKIETEMAFTLSITQIQNIELQKKIEELEKQLQKQNNEKISIKKIEATDAGISKVVARESFSDF